MESFELVSLENGVTSLRSLEKKETFHPGIGPMEEAVVLHVQQQRIIERCLETPNFIIWDVGLGAAANAIATLRALKSAPLVHQVELHSFDVSIEPLRFALQNASALQYPSEFLVEMATLLEKGFVQINEHICWYFHLGDFTQSLCTVMDMPTPHSIFYDPYSLKENTEMWTLQHFQNLHNKLDAQKMCLWSNYTCSTSVRVTLLLAGFAVGTGCAVHKKLQTTIASNHLSAIEKPLGREWLERVFTSHSSAPLRENTFGVSAINQEDFSALIQLPQFL